MSGEGAMESQGTSGTPFEEVEPVEPAKLTIDGDTVVLTYHDAEGAEVEVVYDVVERRTR